MNTFLRNLRCLIPYLCILSAPVSAQTIASSGSYTLEKRDTDRQGNDKVLLAELLKEIESKFKVSIAYQTGLLESIKIDASIVASSRKEVILETSLDKLLKDLHIKYRKSREGFYVLYKEISGAIKNTGENSNLANLQAGVSTQATEQNAITISGKVIDQLSGEGMPGVNVLLKGSAVGTTTDVEGTYKLDIPNNNGILVFSFIGYVTKELEIGSQSVIDIALSEDIQSLSEVIVTALGIAREEKSLGYSVQKVDTKGITQARETNFVNSLQGKLAGVQITGASGNIGGSSRITIRGANSVSGNNQPLFVVDGTPLDNSSANSASTQKGDGGRDYGNAAQDINPDDIESISVLKGPSAAALYGSRAANGVILITTKSGKGGQGLGISFNSSTTLDRVYMLPGYQNAYGGGFKQEFDLYNGEPFVNFSADESWGPALNGRLVRQWDSFFPGPNFGKATPWVAHPDNVKDFYETGKTFSNNIALTAGNEKANLRLSYTNVNQNGTLPNSSLKRNTLSVNATGKLSDKLTAAAKINYVNTDVHGRPVTGDYIGTGAMSVVSSFNTWFQRQVDLKALREYRAPDGSLRNWNLSGPEDLNGFYWNNPYFELYENYSTDVRDRVFGNISLSYQVTPNLTVTGFARTDFYDHRIGERTAEGHVNGSMFLQDNRRVKENNFEVLAQYNRNLGQLFSLAVNAGANARRESYFQNYGKTNGGLNVPNFFNLQASKDRPDLTDFSRRRSVNSVYGSATFGFKDIVYIDGSLRNDWSSTLPVNNNSYLYPAASASLVFSELVPALNILSFGKLRASWARVGNDTDPYRLGITYTPGTPFGNTQIFYVPDVLNNAILKPERSTSYELGADLRFLNGRIGIDATYYNVATTDQILDLPVSATTGYGFAIVNAGKITNKGIELMLTGSPVKTEGGLQWDVTVNWARNRNKVVALAEGQDNYQLARAYRNLTVNAQVGQPYGTLIGTGYKLNENGQRLVSSNGFYEKETGKVLGSVLPDYTGGINNTFTYKGIVFSTLIDFRKGGDIFSVTHATGTYAGLLEETALLNDRGNPMRDPVSEGGGVRAEGVLENGEVNTTYLDAQDYWKDVLTVNEASIYDGSFVKLREIRLGYTFSKRFFASLPIQSMSFSIVGRNVAILHRNTPHFDPETTLGTGNVQGIESAQLPSTRSLGFNLNVSF